MDLLTQAAVLDAAGEDFALLYSGLRTSYSGARSLLAHRPIARVQGEDFSALEAALKETPSPLPSPWFGWLGYGLRHALEDLPKDAPSWITLPALCMTRFADVTEAPYAPHAFSCATTEHAIRELSSNMTRPEYLEHIARTREEIRAGRFYQANITRKFYGTLREGIAPQALFRRLCAISPAPYAAWIRVGATHILSSSPELFLRITSDGQMTTRPIKGSAPASSPQGLLRDSEKDRAENLMIADLMRNDFSRVAELGSVHAPELFGVDRFSTIQHLSSTIEAKLDARHHVLDAVRACFPPGSMTGAPKISAMRWCSAVEGMERGVYSGALGWIAPDACELSVVIRTLVLQGDRFEFQVGGGIVADSDPEAEWQETLTKARGIARALGLEEDALAQL